MAKFLLLRGGLVLMKTSTHCGMPIFLKVNHQLESRMQEICQSGSEGGAKPTFVPTPISNAWACPARPSWPSVTDRWASGLLCRKYTVQSLSNVAGYIRQPKSWIKCPKAFKAKRSN